MFLRFKKYPKFKKMNNDEIYISVSLVYLCISHKRKSQQNLSRNYFITSVFVSLFENISSSISLCISISLYIWLYSYSPYLWMTISLYISDLPILCQLRFIWNSIFQEDRYCRQYTHHVNHLLLRLLWSLYEPR